MITKPNVMYNEILVNENIAKIVILCINLMSLINLIKFVNFGEKM